MSIAENVARIRREMARAALAAGRCGSRSGGKSCCTAIGMPFCDTGKEET